MLKNKVREVEMELTGYCNLQCPLCTRNYSYTQHLRKRNERSLSEITKQLDQFTNMDLFYIAGTSSEPTFYKEFFDLIKYTKDRGIRIELFTNGNTHDEKWWAHLATLMDDRDQVYFAVAGETQEVHEKYRIGSNLQQILNNAAAFRSENRNDYLQFIRLEYNRDSLYTDRFEEMLSPFRDLWLVDSDMKRGPHNYKRPVADGIGPYIERQEKLKTLMSMRPKVGIGTMDALCIEQDSIFIDQYGKIYGCYNYAKEVGKEPLIETDTVIDFGPIECFKNEVCLRCEKGMRALTRELDLGYIY